MKVREGGRDYDVAIVCSVGVNQGFVLVGNKDYPKIADDYIAQLQNLEGPSCRRVPRSSRRFLRSCREIPQAGARRLEPVYRSGGVQSLRRQDGGRVQRQAGRAKEGGEITEENRLRLEKQLQGLEPWNRLMPQSHQNLANNRKGRHFGDNLNLDVSIVVERSSQSRR